jgi:hypothetical protein
VDVGDLNAELLSPLVGETFTVVGVPHELATLVLDSVAEFDPTPGAPRQDPFALTFVGAAGDHLPQATYGLEHPVVGSVGIFLVPLGPAADGQHRYQAVFN